LALQKFLKRLNRKRKRHLLFDETAIIAQEKSVDLLMREELHNECLLERCFDDPISIKNSF